MKKAFGLTVILMLLVSFCFAQDIDPDSEKSVKAASIALINAMKTGEYETATADFDETMKRVSGADKLAELWGQLQLQNGSFKRYSHTRLERYDKYINAFVTCVFENEMIDMKLVFDPDLKIAGMWIVPTWSVPRYVRKTKFSEEQIVFGIQDWELPGTLTLPTGEDPFPLSSWYTVPVPMTATKRLAPISRSRTLPGGSHREVLLYSVTSSVHGITARSSWHLKSPSRFTRRLSRMDWKQLPCCGHIIKTKLIRTVSIYSGTVWAA